MSELAAPLPRTATALAPAPSPARRRNLVAVVAACALIATVLAATLAPWLPLPDPDTVDTPSRLRPPLTAGHVLGTDEFGRDLMSRLVWGARVSLLAGVGTAGLAMLVGVALGVLGGFYTGWIETVVMRLTDILMAFPPFLPATATVPGVGPGRPTAVTAIAMAGFPLSPRLVRGGVLTVKQLDLVEAARALGSREATI